MATADIRSFIESRLKAFDPSMDLDPGSPAQTQVIDPIIRKLGTDPFDTDIMTFISDRLRQEFPNLFAGDPSVVNDILVKPLVLLLEPLKREINSIKINQSLADPDLLSDEDADDLVANIFESRNGGNFSTGVVRLYFQNPISVQVEITHKFSTSDGLSFYPAIPINITAEEMVFNKLGGLYYFDVSVRAEKEGTEYNVPEDAITFVENLFGVIKVSNPRTFSGGAVKLANTDFIARATQALTERSLVTRRGATAKILEQFENEVSAVQVIGAGDPEMERDIIRADSPGHSFLFGQASLYGNLALVTCTVVDSIGSPEVVPGDTLFVYLDKYAYSNSWFYLPQEDRTVKLKVEEVIIGPVDVNLGGVQTAFLLRWSGAFPTGVTIPPTGNSVTTLNGGISKRGSVHIGSLPGNDSVNFSVNDEEVHVFGHTDVFVRSLVQNASVATLPGVKSDSKLGGVIIEGATLSSFGESITTSQRNVVSDVTNFGVVGVESGDILIVESGADTGTYTIGKVVGTQLFLTQRLSKSATNLRFRIVRSVMIDPFEVKHRKVPFGHDVNNDLSTSINSNVMTFSGPNTDLVNRGVIAGDTIRLYPGTSKQADFVITKVVSGTVVEVDSKYPSSESAVVYEIFTLFESVEKPLVRIKDISVLDSSSQQTGIKVPHADPVANVATCNFAGAATLGFSTRRSGFVLPSLTFSDTTPTGFYVQATNVAAVSGDRRYSLGFDPTNGGVFKAMLFPDASQGEFLFPRDAESCSYFLAISENTDKTVNLPPVDPKPGESLVIKTGPNRGSYLIDSVYKFKHKLTGKDVWSYFIKIHGIFPVDVFRDLFTFLDGSSNVSAHVPKITNIAGTISYPGFFETEFSALGTRLNAALTTLGITVFSNSTLQSLIESLTQVEYEWGSPARGTIRSYFLEPTTIQLNTAKSNNPTIFGYDNGSDILMFRPDISQYSEHTLIPPRRGADVGVMEYPRDLVPNPALQTNPSFSDTSRPKVFELGVAPGDELHVHDEVRFYGSDGAYATNTNPSFDRMVAVSSVENSATIVAPPGASAPFTQEMEGDYLFIEEGDDSGAYKVSKFVDGSTLVLDRALTSTSPTVIYSGSGASWGFDTGVNKVVLTSPLTGILNYYITIFGMDSRYQGSYEIIGVSGNTLTVNRPGAIGNFPAGLIADARWIITTSPSVPVTTSLGTELTSLSPVRIYRDSPTKLSVTAVESDLTLASKLTVSSSVYGGVAQPFKIVRKNIRRFNTTEMSTNRESAFYFMDTEVVSFGNNPVNNVPKKTQFELEKNSFYSYGFRQNVDDNTLSYSSRETGSLEITPTIIPADVDDSLDQHTEVLEIPVQIAYERSDAVSSVDGFVNSNEDRVASANLLTRHMIPSYVSYDVNYSGGSSPGVITKDITDYLESLSIESEIDVSELEKLLIQRGGNPDTPTTAYITIHDLNRRVWMEFDQNKLGGSSIKSPFKGSTRLLYSKPGVDASGEVPETGERIRLTQE